MLNQMMVFFVIMIVGFLCRKYGLFDDLSVRKISALVSTVANPACMIGSVMNMEEEIPKADLLTVCMLAVSMYAILLLLALVTPRLLRASKEDAGAYRIMMIFSNIGFMGYPLLSSLHGNQGVLFAIPFNIIYSILIYTVGIKMISPEYADQKMPLKKILNIGVISSLLAIVLFLTKIPVPSFLDRAMDTLGNLTAPLSMLVIGDAMANMKLKELFTDVRLLIFTVFKLIVLPIILLFIAKHLGVTPLILNVYLVMVATPVGSMTAIIAQQYNGNYRLASRGVAISTILSVATMPLISALLQYL